MSPWYKESRPLWSLSCLLQIWALQGRVKEAHSSSWVDAVVYPRSRCPQPALRSQSTSRGWNRDSFKSRKKAPSGGQWWRHVLHRERGLVHSTQEIPLQKKFYSLQLTFAGQFGGGVLCPMLEIKEETDSYFPKERIWELWRMMTIFWRAVVFWFTPSGAQNLILAMLRGSVPQVNWLQDKHPTLCTISPALDAFMWAVKTLSSRLPNSQWSLYALCSLFHFPSKQTVPKGIRGTECLSNLLSIEKQARRIRVWNAASCTPLQQMES